MTEVLVVDHNGMLDEITSALEVRGVTTHRTVAAETALTNLRTLAVDGVVSPPELSAFDGVELLRRVREADPAVAVVLVIDGANLGILNRAHAAGIDDVLALDAADPESVATRIRSAVASQRLTADVDRHNQVTAAVLDAIKVVVTADSREGIEQAVCDSLVRSGHYPVAWISGYDEETNTYTPRAAAGIDVAHLGARPMDESVISQTGIVVQDADGDATYHTVSATLVHERQRYGRLQLSSPHPPDPSERRILETLGSVVAAALHAMETPAGPDIEFERFSGVLAHELRNSLQTAQSHLALAEEGDGDEHFEGLRVALDRLGRLADEADLIARRTIVPGDRSVRDLETSVTAAWNRIHVPDVTMTVVDSGPIEAHQSLLQVLFENLFRNSVNHGSDTIRVGTLEDGFYVEDTGTGIPPEDRDRVFEWGFTTTDHGTGLGLALVDRIAEAHGWSVTLTEESDGGARFEVTGI